jgi:UDP-N-acetyl-D-galactosamine dehydrogenase
VYDPWADPDEAQREYGIGLIEEPQQGVYDGIVIAVAHRQFAGLGAAGIRAFGAPNSVVYDIKHVLPKEDVDGRL